MSSENEALSVDRLLRLRPSDIERLKDDIGSKSTLENLSLVLCQYLLSRKNISIADEDDLYRVALQVNMTGYWKYINPGNIVDALGDKISEDVTTVLFDAVGAGTVLKSSKLAVTEIGSAVLRDTLSKLGMPNPLAAEPRKNSTTKRLVSEPETPRKPVRKKAKSNERQVSKTTYRLADPDTDARKQHDRRRAFWAVQKSKEIMERRKSNLRKELQVTGDPEIKAMIRNELRRIEMSERARDMKHPTLKKKKGTTEKKFRIFQRNKKVHTPGQLGSQTSNEKPGSIDDILANRHVNKN